MILVNQGIGTSVPEKVEKYLRGVDTMEDTMSRSTFDINFYSPEATQ